MAEHPLRRGPLAVLERERRHGGSAAEAEGEQNKGKKAKNTASLSLRYTRCYLQLLTPCCFLPHQPSCTACISSTGALLVKVSILLLSNLFVTVTVPTAATLCQRV